MRNQLFYSSVSPSKLNAHSVATFRGRFIMGTYTLKSIGKATDYMTIVREMDDGYVVRIVRDKDGYEDITNDYISKSLFESCVRTGYLTKVAEPVTAIA